MNRDLYTLTGMSVQGMPVQKCVDKDTIVQNVLSEIGSREEYVVLMHDAGAKTTTVEALPEIIEYLQANDYMILPITANTKPVQHRHS